VKHADGKSDVIAEPTDRIEVNRAARKEKFVVRAGAC
jgi:hypothetical protein